MVVSGHWTGDNYATWEHLYLSVTGMLSFQLFGIPQYAAHGVGRERTRGWAARADAGVGLMDHRVRAGVRGRRGAGAKGN